MNLEQNNKGASGVALKYLLAAAQAHIGRIETSHQSLLENTVGALRLDSRLCEAGDIFVAFAGKQVDGHDYIAQVIEKDVAAPMNFSSIPCLSFRTNPGPFALQMEIVSSTPSETHIKRAIPNFFAAIIYA